jgi:PAS domain S-box-containing protein
MSRDKWAKKVKASAEGGPSLEALREAELRYRTIFKQSPDGILIIDTGGKIIEFNDAAPRSLGYTREEFTQLHVSDIDPDETSEDVRASIRRVLEEGKAEFEVRHKTKTGEIRDVRVIAQAMTLQNRTVLHTIWRDITERKRAEEMLRESENFLQTVIETAPECVKLVASDGALLMMNSAGLAMIEADTFAKVKGKSIYPLISPEYLDSFIALHKSVLEGKAGNLEFEMTSLRGRRLFLETHAVPLKNKKNEIIALLGITRDITERKKMETEILRAQKIESVGVLAGGIAHDFNNLLTAIIGYISIAQMDAGPSGKILPNLKNAEKAAFRARDLTQQLLTFSRGGTPIKKVVSLGDMIKDAAGFALRGSNVKCDFSIPHDLWPAEADEGQISQVINNLVINADQAMPQGGVVRVRCQNEVVGPESGLPLKNGKYVTILIEDKGVGIPKEQLPRIFDPYFTTKQKGSGLGLTAAYSIIKRHDGYIEVDSEPGVGTVFRLYLPAIVAEAAGKVKGEEEVFFGKGRVLVMDDEEIVRSVAGEMLKSLGYDVEFAERGETAIDRFLNARESGRPFDALIIDLTIPGGMGGKDTIGKLSSIDPEVKAIVSSGYSNDPVMADYRSYGFSAVLTKPYKIRELSETLRHVITGRK